LTEGADEFQINLLNANT
jgi:hypothetical protein